MGLYINQDSKGNYLPAKGKLQALLNDGATIQETPTFIPSKTVCVVDNGVFDAAGYAFDEGEFNVWVNDHSGRPKTFITYEHAEALAV